MSICKKGLLFLSHNLKNVLRSIQSTINPLHSLIIFVLILNHFTITVASSVVLVNPNITQDDNFTQLINSSNYSYVNGSGYQFVTLPYHFEKEEFNITGLLHISGLGCDASDYQPNTIALVSISPFTCTIVTKAKIAQSVGVLAVLHGIETDVDVSPGRDLRNKRAGSSDIYIPVLITTQKDKEHLIGLVRNYSSVVVTLVPGTNLWNSIYDSPGFIVAQVILVLFSLVTIGFLVHRQYSFISDRGLEKSVSQLFIWFSITTSFLIFIQSLNFSQSRGLYYNFYEYFADYFTLALTIMGCLLLTLYLLESVTSSLTTPITPWFSRFSPLFFAICTILLCLSIIGAIVIDLGNGSSFSIPAALGIIFNVCIVLFAIFYIYVGKLLIIDVL
eukprot:TRINITY_DN2754_c0_g1_i2.p1 TRINITY_DN2754_c0_g1~~TRINITY_DN2754_c0_g1_i2.p1  ORF type:complete len:389 (-),score=10.35 TRINITY_DN2754_c0_g1_i2:495-1661(-)